VAVKAAKQAKGAVANAMAAYWVAYAIIDISELAVNKLANCIAAFVEIILPATNSKPLKAVGTERAVFIIVSDDKIVDPIEQELLNAFVPDSLAASRFCAALL